MAEPKDLDFLTGDAADRLVADDPFWSTVVRRHADVDVVVLPPQATVEPVVLADEPEVAVESARQNLRSRLADLWAALDLPAEPSHVDDVWFAGAVDGTLRWQGTATFDDLDPVAASRVLERVQELLPEDAGWHVLVPPAGIARVLAGRDGRLGRDEVQVLLASSSRLVIRQRAEPVFVGTDAAAAALRGED